MRITAVIAAIGVGVSITAVALAVAGRVVRIAAAAAETTCGKGRNQDPSERHHYFSRVNRFHMFARRFGAVSMDAYSFDDDATPAAPASFFAALIGTAFERRSNPPSP